MSDQLAVWLAFVLGGLVTFLQRGSFILFSGERTLPEPMQRALRYVAPAAFAAIVAPRILPGFDVGILTPPDAKLLAAVAGGIFMWKIPRLPLLLAFGMTVFWILRWIGL